MNRRLAVLILLPLLFGQQCIEPIANPTDSQPPSTSSPRVTLQTNRGHIVIELFTQQSEAAASFQNLLDEGYYDDAIFHEVQSGLWIEGGAYAADLTLKASQDLVNDAENGLSNFRGRVALYGPDGVSSGLPKFRINLVDNPDMDFDPESETLPDYTVIGRVYSGMDVVDEIGELATTSQTAGDNSTLANLPETPVSVNNPSLSTTAYPEPETKEPEEQIFGLQAAVLYAAGDNPSAVAIADVDGKNGVDLIVTNRDSDTVSILLNEGDGTFGSAVAYNVGTSPVAVFADDFNEDNDPDLAVINTESQSVSILLNQGDGTFEADSSISTGNNPTAITVADFNNDSHLDLAVANSTSDNVTTAMGNGDGTFSFVTTISVVPDPEVAEGETPPEPIDAESPTDIAAADLDADGDVDLVVANTDTDNASILLNDGTGVFTSETAWDLGSNPSGITTVDLDGQNQIDLAACNASPDNTAIVRLNNGSGQFTLSDTFDADTNPSGIAAGPLDSDSHDDLVVANADSDNISVLINKGTGSFEDAQNFAVGTSPTAVALDDLDDDGDQDVVVTTSDGVAVLLNSTVATSNDGENVPNNESFTTTSSGLKYRDAVVGTGQQVTPTSTIQALYTGRLDDENGEIFDQATDPENPAEFPLTNLIQGWQEGLGNYNMRVGGTRILIIPPDLGYGERGSGDSIPPNSTLYFEVEVLGIVQ